MYNPNQCSDDYCEWIELYNPTNESINLTGWKISDMNSNLSIEYNHSITFINQTNISANGYFILARNPSNFSYYWEVSCPIAKFSTSGLNNDQEIIRIYSANSFLIDEVYYDNSIGADGDGKSLQLCNSSFIPNIPTPGSENNCSQGGNEPPPQQQESFIKITDSPNDAKFGEEIDIELEIYRGNTSKYAVYIYVEDEDGRDVSEKISLHCDDKFTNYTEQISLELDCKDEQGDYIIVAEGLNERDEEEIEIASCHDIQEEENASGEEVGSEGVTIGDFTYALTIPNTIYVGEKFQIQASIASQAEQDQEFLVWSYVYITSKCYSCSGETRESNAKSIIVPSGASTEVGLENIVQEAEQGIYKLKIKILQQGLKTPKEFTYDINILNNQNIDTEANSQQTTTQNSTVPTTTYAAYSKTSEQQSESFSFMEFGPYILTSIALLAAIYLIITKI